MSEIWNFSPTLHDQVQLCISAARKDPQSKWIKEFGHLTARHGNHITHNPAKVAENSQPIEILSENDIIDNEGDKECTKNRKTPEGTVENVDEIIDNLETDFFAKADLIFEECVKDSHLLVSLALKLSTHTVDKFCKHICNKEHDSNKFLSKYFEYFLLNYVKRSYNSSTLDILVVTNKKFPLEFKIFLEKLTKDVNIPKQVLQDFINSLNENESSNFIIDLSEFELTSQQFSNNLFAIYTVYKECRKSERIQRYIESLLIQHATYCVTDRHFGRLLLAYLQTQKSLKMPLIDNKIELIIDSHRSPFKRPCLMLLKEMYGDKQNDLSSEDDSDE